MAKGKTMPSPSQPVDALCLQLKKLDGQFFNRYQKLLGKTFHQDGYHLRFIHIQGSPGAFPASVCRLRFNIAGLGLSLEDLSNGPRRMATADYLLRALHAGVAAHARQNRGVQGSGSYQPLSLPPQVLERNVVRFARETVEIAFRISLPGSPDQRILGREAVEMFSLELPGIVATLKAWVAKAARLKRHCDVVEDMVVLQGQLARCDLVAFIGDGAILPRQSGVSQAPLKKNAVPFRAPANLAVEVELTNAGRKRGLGIRPGVNVLIGGGFHGKSTLLDALVKGVYPHIPGDGREQVVTHPEAAFICAEDGRAVTDLDISGFIDALPGTADARTFRTTNASGSTSEAAAIIEAVLAGAKLLLIDEDSSAANLLIKDQNMRKLIPRDPITPLFNRVQELYQRFGVSTLIVVGGSSEYLGVAEQVIAMQDYLPVCMTDQVRRLALPRPQKPADPLILSDRRRVRSRNFNPAYRSRRLGKTYSVRIKPLRLQDQVLEYGNDQLDLTKSRALVDPLQVLAIGYALLLARKRFKDRSLSPSDLAGAIHHLIEAKGLGALCPGKNSPVFLALPRRLELAGAINRLRSLKVDIVEA
jgi:predicted ABC-class ATPase